MEDKYFLNCKHLSAYIGYYILKCSDGFYWGYKKMLKLVFIVYLLTTLRLFVLLTYKFYFSCTILDCFEY